MLDRLWKGLVGLLPLYPNQYWGGENYDLLLERETITNFLQEIINDRDIGERVEKIHLFGSLLSIKGRSKHSRTIGDIDLYFQVDKLDIHLNKSIDAKFKDAPYPYGLKMNFVLDQYPIFECIALPMVTKFMQLYP